MCIFCKIIQKEIPANLIYEDDDIMAFLDVHPVTQGHTLVIPKSHYETIYDCPTHLLEKMIGVTKKLAIQLTNEYNALGVNIRNNNKEVAGQTVPHIHFHIIPRYNSHEEIKI